MKPPRRIIILALSLIWASCAGSPPGREPGKSQAPVERKREASSAPIERPTTGLEAEVFADLPDGVAAYLELIAEAVRKRDADFLLSQGERDYAARVRAMVDDASYLALLYRVGPYSAEKPFDDERPPRLDVRRLRAIRYTGWEERGPVAEVRALLILSEGPAFPCRITVLWKLSAPRIIGQEP